MQITRRSLGTIIRVVPIHAIMQTGGVAVYVLVSAALLQLYLARAVSAGTGSYSVGAAVAGSAQVQPQTQTLSPPCRLLVEHLGGIAAPPVVSTATPRFSFLPHSLAGPHPGNGVAMGACRIVVHTTGAGVGAG